MFDIGFSELAVIGVVALIVIGPEELPRVARTAGHLLGRLRRYVSDVKSDISREMEIADLKRMQESIQQEVHNVQQSINDEAHAFEQGMRDSMAALQSETIHHPDPVPHHIRTPEHEKLAEPAAEQPVDPNQLDMFGEPVKAPEKT